MIKIGVIGAGNIANTFCEAVNKGNMDARLEAIASRNLEKAEKYQKTYGFKKAYGNYQDLYNDSSIDLIYLATPHGLHYEQMLEILDYSKNILCEKSFTLNEVQAKEVFHKAKEKQVFIMEAMWTKFLPTIQEVQEIVKSGLIGKIIKVESDFCFKSPKSDDSRLFNPELGGGALLDVGIYPITFANLFMGIPDEITSTVKKHRTGVDLTERIFFKYPQGEAILNASLGKFMPLRGRIYGEKGYIRVINPHKAQKAFVYDQNGKLIKRIKHPHPVNGFEYEINEVVDCIKNNQLESNIHPPIATLAIMRQMDTIRKSWNMTFPKEK